MARVILRFYSNSRRKSCVIGDMRKTDSHFYRTRIELSLQPTRERCPVLMNRRSFIYNSALLAAGSSVGVSLGGCGVDVFVIPCLGPAAPPTPVPGMTYIRASEIGCALDCNLRNGRNKYTGGAATDDGPRINEAMAGATADHPIMLIIDGSALISGLFLPAAGNWSIAGLGCGTGFFVKTGSNNDGIHNGSAGAEIPFDPGPPAPERGSNVSLSNFTINGNQGNGHNGNSTSGTRQGIDGAVWYCAINLVSLNNVTIDKVVVVRSSSYHVRLSNVGHVMIAGCVMESHGLSTDGLHFDGPSNDIAISGCHFATDDDSIALNCPEGYSGDISRVTVTNCTFKSWSLMRLYTLLPGGGNRSRIDTVIVSQCSGTLEEAAFLIGLCEGSYPNSVDGLTISECQLTAPAVIALGENFGTITLNKVVFTPSTRNVVWIEPQVNKICGFLRPTPLYPTLTCAGGTLTFNDCVIQRVSDIKVAPVMLEKDSTIGTVEFNGFALQDAGSYSPAPELLNIGSGSVGQLVLSSVETANIQAPVSPGGFASVGSVSGAGVLATAWEFPDAVMADGVPYISASTGTPSIKVGNVVEPYPQG